LYSAEQDFANYFTVLVFLYDLFDGICVLLPYFFSDERRICQYKVKIIVVLFRNVFGVVEVVGKKIRVIFAKFAIELGSAEVTSKRKRGR
jgi:hypothetical protein